MRKEFEMTEEQRNKLLDAMKPVPYMVIGGVEPRSLQDLQDRANDAWDELGREMGFVGSTAQAVPGKGERFFTAEVSATIVIQTKVHDDPPIPPAYTYRVALEQIVKVLGPNVPNSVTDQGARWEWNEALKIAQEALEEDE